MGFVDIKISYFSNQIFVIYKIQECFFLENYFGNFVNNKIKK